VQEPVAFLQIAQQNLALVPLLLKKCIRYDGIILSMAMMGDTNKEQG